MNDTETFTLYSRPDSHGRQSFGIRWYDENHHSGYKNRGQMFFAVLDGYVTKAKEKGKQVVIVEEYER
jgi:hypothetical protein